MGKYILCSFARMHSGARALPDHVCMGPGSWVLADWRLYEPLGMKLPEGPSCSMASTIATQRARSWLTNIKCTHKACVSSACLLHS